MSNNHIDATKLDPNKMNLDMLRSAVSFVFSQNEPVPPGFLNGRNTEDFVYAYMLTKDYPEGSGNKVTFEQLINDDSPEMQEFKRNSGKEFCSIFMKGGNDISQKYNEEAYPTLLKMTDAMINQKFERHDLSNENDIRNAFIDAKRVNVIFNVNQQLDHASNLSKLTAKNNGLCRVYSDMLSGRLGFLCSETYRNDAKIDRTEIIKIMNTQVMADSTDMKNLHGIPIGSLDIETSYALMVSTSSCCEELITMPYNTIVEEAQKYRNGQENRIKEIWENSNQKRDIEKANKAAAKVVEKQPEDLIIENISNGTGAYVFGAYNLTPEILDKFARGESVYGSMVDAQSGGVGDIEHMAGIKTGLLNMLTGCPVIEKAPDEITEREKKMLMAAANTIYINGETMAKRFNLSEDTIAQDIKEAERSLAALMKESSANNGPDYFYARCGDKSFAAITISGSREYNKTAKACAQYISCNGSDNELKESLDILKKNNIEFASYKMDFDSAYSTFVNSTRGATLANLAGRSLESESDYAEAAKRIYIGNKTLAELCPRGDKTLEQNINDMEKLLEDAYYNNIHMKSENKVFQPIFIRDDRGDLKALTVDPGRPPKRPDPVEPPTGLKALLRNKAQRERDNEILAKYISEETKYVNEMSQYNRCIAYNEAAEKMRISIMREEKNGPTVRNVSIAQLQGNSLSAYSNNNMALTRPNVEHNMQAGAHSL